MPTKKRVLLWSAFVMICACIVVGSFAGLAAATGLVAIAAAITVGLAMQDALGAVAMKAVERVLIVIGRR